MAIVAARLDNHSPTHSRIDLSMVDELVESLADIRRAIIQMRPSPEQAKRLDRIYTSVVIAQSGLLELAGYHSVDTINRELSAD